MTLREFASSMLPAEVLTAYDEPERQAAFASLEAAAATIAHPRDRVIAQRSLLVLREAVADFLRMKGFRFTW